MTNSEQINTAYDLYKDKVMEDMKAKYQKWLMNELEMSQKEIDIAIERNDINVSLKKNCIGNGTTFILSKKVSQFTYNFPELKDD